MPKNKYFSDVYTAPGFPKYLLDHPSVLQFINGELNGSDFEHLRRKRHKFFSIRLNDSERVIGVLRHFRGRESAILLENLNCRHRYDRCFYLNNPTALNWLLETSDGLELVGTIEPLELELGLQSDSKIEHEHHVHTHTHALPSQSELLLAPIRHSIKPRQLKFTQNKFICFDDEQEEAARVSELPLLLSGGPGTGKTCIAEDILSQVAVQTDRFKRIVYLTQSPGLVKDTRESCQNNPMIRGRDIEFLTYEQLIVKHLSKEEAERFRCQEKVGYDHFEAWLRKHKKRLRKQITPKSTVLQDTHELYEEFRIISNLDAQSYKKLGTFQSIFIDDGDRQDVYTIFSKYLNHLKETKRIDLCFYRPKELNIQAYDYTIIDEGQDFSRLQNEILINFAIQFKQCSTAKTTVPKIGLTFCIDTNQSLFDGISIRESLKRMIYLRSKLPVEERVLQGSYRTPANILEVANRALSTKHNILGALSDKLEPASIRPAKSLADRVGELRFHDDLDCPDLVRRVRNSADFVVVIPHQSFRAEAVQKFGAHVNIITVNEAKGLTLKKVVGYRLFDHEPDQDIFKMANKFCAKNYQVEIQARSKDKFNKDATRVAPVFNGIFMTITRATEGFYFLGLPMVKFAELLKFMKGDSEVRFAKMAKAAEEKVSSEAEWIASYQRLQDYGVDMDIKQKAEELKALRDPDSKQSSAKSSKASTQPPRKTKAKKSKKRSAKSGKGGKHVAVQPSVLSPDGHQGDHKKWTSMLTSLGKDMHAEKSKETKQANEKKGIPLTKVAKPGERFKTIQEVRRKYEKSCKWKDWIAKLLVTFTDDNIHTLIEHTSKPKKMFILFMDLRDVFSEAPPGRNLIEMILLSEHYKEKFFRCLNARPQTEVNQYLVNLFSRPQILEVETSDPSYLGLSTFSVLLSSLQTRYFFLENEIWRKLPQAKFAEALTATYQAQHPRLKTLAGFCSFIFLLGEPDQLGQGNRAQSIVNLFSLPAVLKALPLEIFNMKYEYESGRKIKLLSWLHENNCPRSVLINYIEMHKSESSADILLHAECDSNLNPEMIPFLKEQGATASTQNRSHRTPFMVAAVEHNQIAMRALCRSYPDAMLHGNGYGYMYHVIEQKCFPLVDFLLKIGFDINRTYHHTKGHVLPFAAKVNSSPAICELLLKHGADPSATIDGMNALMFYALDNNVEAIRILVKAGMSVNALVGDKIKQNVLHLAARDPAVKPYTFRALLSLEGDVCSYDSTGCKLSSLLYTHKRRDLLKVLYEIYPYLEMSREFYASSSQEMLYGYQLISDPIVEPVIERPGKEQEDVKLKRELLHLSADEVNEMMSSGTTSSVTPSMTMSSLTSSFRPSVTPDMSMSSLPPSVAPDMTMPSPTSSYRASMMATTRELPLSRQLTGVSAFSAATSSAIFSASSSTTASVPSPSVSSPSDAFPSDVFPGVGSYGAQASLHPEASLDCLDIIEVRHAVCRDDNKMKHK
jgi:hypothetical protein